jgi:hypothetical protein
LVNGVETVNGKIRFRGATEPEWIKRFGSFRSPTIAFISA